MGDDPPSPMTTYAQLQRSLATGWNTWNTRSVTSHVLLPAGLALNLVFKSYAHSALLREALIGRPGRDAEKIHPAGHADDGSYTDLGLAWRDVNVRVQSAVDEDGGLVLLLTPRGSAIKPPVVALEAGFLWNRPGSSRLGPTTDSLLATMADSSQTITCHTSGQVVAEPYTGAASPYLAVSLAGQVGFSTGRRRTLAEIAAIVERRQAEHAQRKSPYGSQAELYAAIQTCTAWCTIYDPLKDRVITPVSRVWNTDRRGGYVLFCWDTYFAAALAAIDNEALACANAVEITREATEGGFVPNNTQATGRASRDRSQPPVGSLVVRDLHRRFKKLWLIEEVFPALLTWNRWWPAHRQNGELLSWGSDPFEPVVGDPLEREQPNTAEGAILETGLDNSPMYDGVPFDCDRHVMQLHDVGLNSLYIADCLALAELADAIGRAAEASELRQRAARYSAAMESLWDETAGLYLNRRTDTGAFEHRLSPTHFYPLLARVPSADRARRMVEEHLLNPREFWGEWVLPSIARNDPSYPEQDYWRGRIWPPMNYLVFLGLANYPALRPVQEELARKSADLLLGEWQSHGHVHENYGGDSGLGCDSPRSDAFYHWGALLGLTALSPAGGNLSGTLASNGSAF